MATINSVGLGLKGASGTGNFAGTTAPVLSLPSANNFLAALTSTATAAGTTVLTVNSNHTQEFTGSTTQTVTMPVTSTLTAGQQYYIINNSSGVVTVQSSGGNTIQALAANTSVLLTCVSTSGTTAASWQSSYLTDAGGTVNSGTANQVAYYATSGNAVSGLSGSNNTVLVVNGSGALGFTSAPSLSAIVDANGANYVGFSSVASSVNNIIVQNNSTGNAPVVYVDGADSNIIFQLAGKGTGGVSLKGTGTNNNAPGGYVGEFVSNVVATASPVSLTNGTPANVTSISLTAGDWDVWGNVSSAFTGASGSAGAYSSCWISTTSATQPDLSLVSLSSITINDYSNVSLPAPQLRLSINSTTTVYLSVLAYFSTAGTACGGIYARRRR